MARHARVSLKTVSRVVNEEPGVRVETAEQVRAVIAELGFRRNDGARQLRRGRTASVGLVVESITDPFYSGLTAAVERVARLRRHLLISGSAEGAADREESLAGALLARRVDGIIIVPAGQTHSWLADEIESGTPIVFVDRPPGDIEVDTVLTDNEGGMRSAVEHLAAYGHRRIGFLADDAELWTAQRRREGFEAAVASLGLREAPIAMGPYPADTLAGVLRQWSDGDRAEGAVTAVVTGNNRMTVAALRVLRTLPRPLSLVGFDDFELADMLTPAVTVIAQDPAKLGEAAANLLFARIDGDHAAPQQVVLPTRLIARESVRRAEVGA